MIVFNTIGRLEKKEERNPENERLEELLKQNLRTLVKTQS